MSTRRHLLAGAVALAATAVLPSALAATDPDEARLLRELARYGFPAGERAHVLAAFRRGGPEFRWFALHVFAMTPAELRDFSAYVEARVAARSAAV